MQARELAQLPEGEEAAAWRDFPHMSADARERFGFEVRELGGTSASMTRHLEFGLPNRVLGLGVFQPATEALLDDLLQWYKAAGRGFSVALSPMAEPAERIPRWLEDRGLKVTSRWVKMYRSMNLAIPPSPTELVIRRASGEDAGLVREVLIRSFGFEDGPAEYFGHLETEAPGWTFYLGYVGDTPACTAAIRIDGDVAGLYAGATLPEFRGKGGQGALFERRLRDAAAAGCRWCSTETGEESGGNVNHSYRNMLAAGFQLAYARPNYSWQPE